MKNNKKYLAILIVIFAIISATLTFFLNYEKDEKISSHIQMKTHENTNRYTVFYHEYQNLSNVIYYAIINTPSIMNQLASATHPNANQIKIRNRLYNELLPIYTLFQQQGIKQIHFQTSDNKSFLRMHRPSKFGDDLTLARPSVAYVNKYQKAIDTFEEGKIFSGYRFVYPIFKNNSPLKQNHLGSVEVSFDATNFIKDFAYHYNQESIFLISKNAVNKTIFEEEKINYFNSPLNQFYIENIEIASTFNVNYLNAHQELNQMIFGGKSFSVYISEDKKTISFIPIKNNITNRVVGCFITSSNDPYPYNKTLNFYTTLSVLMVLLAVIFFFLYQEIIRRRKLQESHEQLALEKEKIQHLLNAQNAIVILTNGQHIISANKRFLEFFGMQHLEDFQKEYDCICDKFQHEEGKHYLQKYTDNIAWNQYIKLHPNEIFTVKIANFKNENSIFQITVTTFNTTTQEDVITLNDITKIEHLEYENLITQKQLFEQAKMAQMGEMMGNIAHQWRQPLNAISIIASSMKLEKELELLDDKGLFNACDKIMDATKFLSNTIETFRNFIVDSSDFEEVDINSKILTTLDIIHATLKSSHIEIAFSHTDENIVVNTSPSQLTQVLLNIINNAKDVLIDRNIKEPLIKIQTKIEHNFLYICISDNAGGIHESIMPKIFDPYFTTKHQSQGTGIGLHMCREIVLKYLKGKIYAENIEHGAQFTIELPLA